MFTGIVEGLGRVVEVKSVADGHRLRIETGLARELKAGDSLAVSGVCLTATLIDGDEVHADIGPETARVTTIGDLQRGDLVNLERALRADGRFGGHFVQGHVDGVGQVEEIRVEDDARWVTIGFPARLTQLLVHKGSVTVDGVSLTVAGLGDTRFDVQIIPYTWDNTTFRRFNVGVRVNLEFDMIGKYVVRAMEVAGLGYARRMEE
jgi:riboflavin synthase